MFGVRAARKDMGFSGEGVGAAVNLGLIGVNHKTKPEQVLFCWVLRSAGDKRFHFGLLFYCDQVGLELLSDFAFTIVVFILVFSY